MKPTLLLFNGAVAISFLVTSALASPDDRSKVSQPTLERLGHVEKSSELMGMNVNSLQDNKKIGDVKDLAIDVESGRIVAVIVSVGGFLGLGDKHVALPPGALTRDTTGKALRLNADKDRLKGAPEFHMSKWQDCCQPDAMEKSYRYFGEDPFFVTQKTDGRIDTTEYRNKLVRPELPVRLGHVEKASKINGMSVKNRQDEKLGKVENLMVDLAAGRVVQVIVSTGGFLGLGNELNAVPPAAFRYNAERDTLTLDATKEMLTSAPHFKSTEWPDFADPPYCVTIYRAYRVEPYFSTDADNTRRNVRDRDGKTLTPLDQGSSDADIATTTQIRKELRAREALSVNAQNVKIITVNGRVTLRGVVDTEAEKRILGEIAARTATADKVDNQLEVKRD
jgi:hyperosmotically inducible protein